MFDAIKSFYDDAGILIMLLLALIACILGVMIYATHPTNVMNGDINFKTSNTTKIYPTTETTQTMGVSIQIPTPEYEDLVPGEFYQNQHTDCSYYEGQPFGNC